MTKISFIRQICADSANVSKSHIYLDWNSTSPPHPDVYEAMQCAATHVWANPASVHAPGRRSKNLIESVRDLLARLIGAHPRDIVFTSGGTEANNWALHDVSGLVLSRLEHPSVTRQGERLEKLNRPVRWLDVGATGRVEPDSVSKALIGMPAGTFVAVMAVNHETGVVQPLSAISEPVRKYGAFLHVDAVQALGKLPVTSWNCWDTIAIGAHKIRGPKGIGALAWKSGTPIPPPILVGGAQERGLRPGTVDPVLAAGFGAALDSIGSFRRVLCSVGWPKSAFGVRTSHVGRKQHLRTNPAVGPRIQFVRPRLECRGTRRGPRSRRVVRIQRKCLCGRYCGNIARYHGDARNGKSAVDD